MNIRFIRIILVSLLTAFFSPASFAQDVVEKINEIKLDVDNYLYAESTVETEAKARDFADALLISNINDYFEQEEPSRKFSPADVANFKYLTMKRGSNIRVFVYIRKADLGLSSSDVQASRASESRAQKTTPKRETSGAASASTSAPEYSKPSTRGITRPQQEVIEEIMKAQDMQSARKLLALFTTMRRVESSGVVADCPDFNSCFWIIGNPESGVATVLSPVTSGESRVNLKTGQSDSLENYHGVPVLWFVMK